MNKRWRQSTVQECDGAALLDQAQQAVARMWYRVGLPFSCVSFQEIVDAFDAVAAYGCKASSTVFPLPSAPKLRNERLDREVARIEQELADHKAAMATYGLSLQSDGKDNTAHRHLVNIITTTPLGPEFRDVIDVSGGLRDASSSAQLLMDAVNRLSEIEQESLVSIVTDTQQLTVKCGSCSRHYCLE